MQVLIAISGFCGFCSRIGNTPCTTPFDFLFVISIHVPAWGTTDTAHRGNQSNAEFQSTFPRGERQFSNSDFDVISSFQSTFPRGERRCNNFSTDDTEHFNPRSHVGNDQTPITEQYKQGYFNPRSHVGNDESPQQSYLNSNISIHVPTWGTTEKGLDFFEVLRISIHVPTWGTTPYSRMIVTFKLFQSTFPRGERPEPVERRR